MLDFDDPRWMNLKGGYRVPFDPRPLLRQLESGDDDEAIWSELWENLHHQGDVGVASYAAVTSLVRIQQNHKSVGWNAYALITLIELRRTEPHNPELPIWLKQDYFAAIAEMAKRGLTEMPQVEDKETLLSILAIVALWKGLRVYARLLLNFSEDEVMDLAKEMLG